MEAGRGSTRVPYQAGRLGRSCIRSMWTLRSDKTLRPELQKQALLHGYCKLLEAASTCSIVCEQLFWEVPRFEHGYTSSTPITSTECQRCTSSAAQMQAEFRVERQELTKFTPLSLSLCLVHVSQLLWCNLLCTFKGVSTSYCRALGCFSCSELPFAARTSEAF